MLLTSNSFLFFFFPISLILFFLLKLKDKNKIYLLGILSAYFYFLDNGKLILILIFLALIMKIQIQYKLFNNFIFTLIVLLPLMVFKYLEPILLYFKIDIPNIISSSFPIGLSFFTFQAIAYYFDKERDVSYESTFDIFTFIFLF